MPNDVTGNIVAAGKGETYAACGGIEVKGSAPVLAMCRKLVEAGYEPAEPLEAYRGDVLCLKVRTIGDGAKLVINRNGVGFYSEGGGACRSLAHAFYWRGWRTTKPL